jgi:hypothetical protein
MSLQNSSSAYLKRPIIYLATAHAPEIHTFKLSAGQSRAFTLHC